jgi:hypothetical protein
LRAAQEVRWSEEMERLRASKTKMMLLVVGSSAFVSIGVWMADRGPLIGYAIIVFFGLCGLVGAVGLLPGSSYLELSPDGFLICSLYRKWFVRWVDVEEFIPIRIQLNAMVGWNYSPIYQGGAIGRTVSAALSGVEAALPDTYGMNASELAQLMNEWRRRCGR